MQQSIHQTMILGYLPKENKNDKGLSCLDGLNHWFRPLIRSWVAPTNTNE